jgi:hypothetical protein
LHVRKRVFCDPFFRSEGYDYSHIAQHLRCFGPRSEWSWDCTNPLVEQGRVRQCRN